VIGGHNHATEAAYQFGVLNVGPDTPIKKSKSVESKKKNPVDVANKAKPAEVTIRKVTETVKPVVSLPSVNKPKPVPLAPAQIAKPAKSGWGAPVTLSFGSISSRENEPPSSAQPIEPRKPEAKDINGPSKKNAAGPSKQDIKGWSETEVSKWLSSVASQYGIKEKTVKALFDEDVDGRTLLDMSKEELRSVGISLGQTRALGAAIESLTKPL